MNPPARRPLTQQVAFAAADIEDGCAFTQPAVLAEKHQLLVRDGVEDVQVALDDGEEVEKVRGLSHFAAARNIPIQSRNTQIALGVFGR